MTDHGHHHHADPETINRAFIAGIVLNSIFIAVELVAGFATNSLALLSDAGHNISDVAGLFISLLAFRLAKSGSTKRFTYGLSKTTILASLINAVILLIAIGSIGVEAIRRFMHPEPVEGKIISFVAGAGILINGISAWFFFRHRHHEINTKAAYIHLLSDTLVSAGVVVAGVIIYATGLSWIDPTISLLIMVILLFSTWSILKESIRLSIDAVPENIHLEEIKSVVQKVQGVAGIHHIHVWAMSTTTNSMTAHILLQPSVKQEEIPEIKNRIRHELEHMNIQHITLETETSEDQCEDTDH